MTAGAPLLRAALWLGLGGLAASAAVHAATLAGAPVSPVAFVLHLGVFAAFVPVVLGLWSRVRDGGGAGLRDRAAVRRSFVGVLRAVPLWQRVALGALFAYATANFVLAFASGSADPGDPTPELSGAQMLRAFSGHWAVFYAVSAALAAALLRLRSVEPAPPPLAPGSPGG